MAVRRGVVLVVAKDADLVADAGAAELGDPEPGGDPIRVADAAMEPAAALDAKAHHLVAPGIEPALADQVVGDRGVEEAVVVDVVDVAVDVVVEPAGRDA